MISGYTLYPCMSCPYMVDGGYDLDSEFASYAEDMDVRDENKDTEGMYRQPPFGPRRPFFGPRPFFYPRPFFGPPRPFFFPAPYPVPGPFFVGPGFAPPFLAGLALGGLLF